MSRAHDGPRAFFPLGNPFKRIIPKDSYLSAELLRLQNAFEDTLMDRLKRLHRKELSDIVSLSWLKTAMESLCETHRAVQSLITDLQFPVSEWDELWVDVYLDNSVKLLDISNGFSSEISRLDQTQFLLRYILHVLDQPTGASQEQLKEAHASLCEWSERNSFKSPRLTNSSSILQDLAGTLYLTKVKNSSKGMVLMRAMYAVKVLTIFICSVFFAILSGSTEQLLDLPVSDKFAWAKAFDILQVDVNTEVRRRVSLGRVPVLKELDLVDQCVKKVTILTHLEGRDKLQPTNSNRKEATNFKGSVSDLGMSVGTFTNELDDLSKQVGDFFGIVLAGRDALLCNLRNYHGKKGTRCR